jgi:CubicO group peptidase (beta-lactamase class C family)
MNNMSRMRKYLLQTFVIAACAAFGIATLQAQSSPAIDNYEAAAEYSHSQHGTGVLVMVRGEIVFEDYAPGWTADKPHLLASGTKSFCGVMSACAVHDGLLTLDEKVAETLTEWKDDQRKSQITIRQLLSLSSGIEGGDNGTSAWETAKVASSATMNFLPSCWRRHENRQDSPRDDDFIPYLSEYNRGCVVQATSDRTTHPTTAIIFKGIQHGKWP